MSDNEYFLDSETPDEPFEQVKNILDYEFVESISR